MASMSSTPMSRCTGARETRARTGPAKPWNTRWSMHWRMSCRAAGAVPSSGSASRMRRRHSRAWEWRALWWVTTTSTSQTSRWAWCGETVPAPGRITPASNSRTTKLATELLFMALTMSVSRRTVTSSGTAASPRMPWCTASAVTRRASVAASRRLASRPRQAAWATKACAVGEGGWGKVARTTTSTSPMSSTRSRRASWSRGELFSHSPRKRSISARRPAREAAMRITACTSANDMDCPEVDVGASLQTKSIASALRSAVTRTRSWRSLRNLPRRWTSRSGAACSVCLRVWSA
mmetsp:Transcript_690/g.2189  ORF Transcript_690/g.2189 Transcript_690/m.2189 type:complete len:294 (-) Transcript_690:1115-1996(-)